MGIKNKYQDSIVLHHNYKMGSVLDQSGNGNDGGVNGTPYFSTGIHGKCLTFDGATDYLKVPYNISLYCAETMTVSFWARSRKTNYTSNAFIVSMWDDGGTNEMWAIAIPAISDKFYYETRSGGGGGYTSVDTGLAVDLDWHHFCFTADNTATEWTLYIDGIFEDDAGFLQAYGNRNSFLTIGALDGNSFFEGDISEVLIINALLTPAEVSELYAEGLVEVGHNSNTINSFRKTDQSNNDTLITVDQGISETLVNVTTGLLSDSGWTVDSGTWSIDGGSDRYIECEAAGILSRYTKQAYGTWQFDFYKTSTGALNITMIASEIGNSGVTSQDCYLLMITAAENVQLWRIDNAIASTQIYSSSTGVFTANAWHTFKITRSAAGVFTIYIDDVTLDADLFGTNPTTADNTHTTSSYFNIDNDDGELVKNFKYTPEGF